MAAILPAGNAVYTYTYLIELNHIFYEYELKKRKKKPIPENFIKPRSRGEVKALLSKQTTVLNKTSTLLVDVNNYLEQSEKELDILNNEINALNNIVDKYNLSSVDSEKNILRKDFNNKIDAIIKILRESNYDNTPVFKFQKIEDLEQPEPTNKLIIQKREFKKTFKPKLNKFIEEGKKVIFTGLYDEPYFRLPVPAEIKITEKELTNLGLANLDDKQIINNFVEHINLIYSNHKDYIRSYKQKISLVQNDIFKTINDIDNTNNELANIKEAETVEDVKSAFTYNSFFPVLEKGMLYNFIA